LFDEMPAWIEPDEVTYLAVGWLQPCRAYQ
jgi:hypothetical protein